MEITNIEAMQYLHIIPARFNLLMKKMDEILERVVTLENGVNSLGQACGHAFQQTKNIINHLAETQEELNADISSYGGIIESSTFLEPRTV